MYIMYIIKIIYIYIYIYIFIIRQQVTPLIYNVLILVHLWCKGSSKVPGTRFLKGEAEVAKKNGEAWRLKAEWKGVKMCGFPIWVFPKIGVPPNHQF